METETSLDQSPKNTGVKKNWYNNSAAFCNDRVGTRKNNKYRN